MIYTYLHDGQPHTVRLERAPDGGYTATIGERVFPVQAQPLPDGGWILTIGGERLTVYGASAGGSRYLHAGGRDYTLTVPDTRGKRRGASGAGGDLTAQMPGQVVDVLVAEGDTVEAGQTLVILEAMKMEIRVPAPAAGRVARVLVSKGQVVERGQHLLEIQDT